MDQQQTAATVNFHANEGQWRFLTSQAKVRLGLTGVGGGKSAVGAIETLRLACVNEGIEAFVVSPTLHQLKTNTIPPILKFWPEGIIKNPSPLYSASNQPIRVELFNGSVIHFRSTEKPENLRGPNLGILWMDEPGMMKDYVWEILEGRVRVPCPEPRIIMTGTPKGMNWLHDRFVVRKTPKYEVIRWAAQENSHNLIEGFYEDLIEDYDPLFARQEVYGEFVNIHADTFLSYEHVLACESNSCPKFPKDTRTNLYVGIDVGRHKDLTVIWALFPIGDVWWTAVLKRFDNTPFATQKSYIWNLMPKVAFCCIDATGIGEQMSEELATEFGGIVEPVKFNQRNKLEMGSRTKTMFERQGLRIPKDMETRNDLLSVERFVNNVGQTTLRAARNKDGHADAYTALSLAVHATEFATVYSGEYGYV